MSATFRKPKVRPKHYEKSMKQLPHLERKTIAITGTTSGIGYVSAMSCAQKGARVLLLNRLSDKAKRSLDQLKTNCPKAEFVFIECDLQRFSSVREAASQVITMCPKGLDVLCLNAGVMALKDKATPDGFDVQMQTNHLSHFLLTKLLMPCLNKASRQRGEARIVNHSSIARFMVGTLEAKYFERRGGNLGGNGKRMMLMPQGRWKRYAQTKLANAVFTACLHDKLQAFHSNIKAIVAHPGFAVTDLQETAIKDGGMSAWFTSLMMKMAQSKEDGALGLLTAISGEDVCSGEFIGPGAGRMAIKGPVKRFPLDPICNKKEVKELLWTKSCEAIGEDFDL